MDVVELHQLRCAVAIADEGSFTAAAAVLHLSQPALSYAVGRLERELGTSLFERTPTGTRLTAAGEAFLAPARRTLAEADAAAAAVNGVTGILSGELRVVGIRTAVVETAHMIIRFHQRYGGVRVVVEEPTRDPDVVDLVRSARCDVGLVRTGEVPADLAAVPAGSREVVAIFPAALAPAEMTVTPRAFSDIPMIVPLRGSAARAGHDAFFRQLHVQPVVAAECSHQDTIIEMVRGGVGAALAGQMQAEAIRCDQVEIRALRPRRRDQLSLIRRSVASPAAMAFCELGADAGRAAPPAR